MDPDSPNTVDNNGTALSNSSSNFATDLQVIEALKESIDDRILELSKAWGTLHLPRQSKIYQSALVEFVSDVLWGPDTPPRLKTWCEDIGWVHSSMLLFSHLCGEEESAAFAPERKESNEEAWSYLRGKNFQNILWPPQVEFRSKLKVPLEIQLDSAFEWGYEQAEEFAKKYAPDFDASTELLEPLDESLEHLRHGPIRVPSAYCERLRDSAAFSADWISEPAFVVFAQYLYACFYAKYFCLGPSVWYRKFPPNVLLEMLYTTIRYAYLVGVDPKCVLFFPVRWLGLRSGVFSYFLTKEPDRQRPPLLATVAEIVLNSAYLTDKECDAENRSQRLEAYRTNLENKLHDLREPISIAVFTTSSDLAFLKSQLGEQIDTDRMNHFIANLERREHSLLEYKSQLETVLSEKPESFDDTDYTPSLMKFVKEVETMVRQKHSPPTAALFQPEYHVHPAGTRLRVSSSFSMAVFKLVDNALKAVTRSEIRSGVVKVVFRGTRNRSPEGELWIEIEDNLGAVPGVVVDMIQGLLQHRIHVDKMKGIPIAIRTFHLNDCEVRFHQEPNIHARWSICLHSGRLESVEVSRGPEDLGG